MVFKALLGKIKKGLARTRRVFGDVAVLFRLKGRVDQKFLDELEKRLYLADVGGEATATIVERVRQAFSDKEITGDVEAFVVRGAIAAGLLDFIDQHKIDLVVMTTHARKGLARAALGSVADRVLQGNAPVLLLNPNGS